MQINAHKSFRGATRIAAAVLASVALLPNAASALPTPHALVLKHAVSTQVETVGWRGRGWGWGGRAGYYEPYYRPYYTPYYQPYYYPRYYYYYPAPAYYYPRAYYYAPVYTAQIARDAVAYCIQRFQSYDLGSGTYLGYDGYRHPCP
jgi:hypothetical protein